MISFDTVLPADSVEFCPHRAVCHILACGTYQLDDSGAGNTTISSLDTGRPSQVLKQKRSGRAYIFEVSDGTYGGLQCVQQLSLPAILDMKWCHAQLDDGPLLAIADAEGQITLQRWSITNRHMEKLQSVQCCNSDVLCLSLDWSNRRSPNTVGSLVISSSDGSLSLLRPTDGAFAVSDSRKAHEFEPWAVAWNYWDTNVVYSGGDDLTLKGWDVRQGFSQPFLTNKRFNAGVTTIQSHPYIEHMIAVGSYDNAVRLYDVRKPLEAITEVDVGGGAWRVKWHPDATRSTDLLVACMHDGFKVIRFSSAVLSYGDSTSSGSRVRTESEWQVAKRYDHHDSLAYGVDWSYAKDEKCEDTVIASCSFYDHAVHIWKG